MDRRRLAAILVADVVGYSRLVGADETGTLAKLLALRRGAPQRPCGWQEWQSGHVSQRQ